METGSRVEISTGTSREWRQARELVMLHGSNSTAYQILNPGMRYWFDAGGQTVVGYLPRGRYLLAAGDPIGPVAPLRHTAEAFEAFARAQGRRVCYVCASAGFVERFSGTPRTHAAVVMGAQPVWDPHDWGSVVAARSSLRAQLHRARNKGVAIRQLTADEAAANPELDRVLIDWLEYRSLPPLHFMVEPDILKSGAPDRVVLAALRNHRAIAYLVASPVPARNGFLIEELARTRDAPNGTSELLIDAAMKAFAAAGHEYVTMGLVALAEGSYAGNPWWLRALMHAARAHANRFYNFRGLERFRAKMRPALWEPVYMMSNQPRFTLRALYAVGGAFSGISPVRALGIGILKGAREEFLQRPPKRTAT